MDEVLRLQDALGAELLRARVLGAEPPMLCGRYRIEGFLGRGATGLVVAATDERLGRAVALKLSPVASDAGIAEARALARLEHPNVVRVYDAELVQATIDEQPWRLRVIAMHRIQGRSLRAWLREAPRSPTEIARVFVDAGRGLAAAHEAKIIHRDFKPDNVLVDNDGRAQVIDFGFAAHVQSSQQSQQRGLADIAGTDPYLAPEARLGHATRSSDQFSFGISLVEALTGELGVPSETRPKGVSQATWDVVRRACAMDAKQRYPSMDNLLRALNTQRLWPLPNLTRLQLASLMFVGLVSVMGVIRLGRRDDRVALTTQPAAVTDCAHTAASWEVHNTVIKRNAEEGAPVEWSNMIIRRTTEAHPANDASARQCAFEIQVERLCDWKKRSTYDPGFFLGTGTATLTRPSTGDPQLRTSTVEIQARSKEPGAPRRPGERFTFELSLLPDGPRGRVEVATSAGVAKSVYTVEPLLVSRFQCLPGRSQGSTP